MPYSAVPRLPAPRNPAGPYRVCCVCLGNICRSPMAEVVLRAQVAEAGLVGQDVPDPYYGTDADFARVLTLLETGMANLAGQLRVITGVRAER